MTTNALADLLSSNARLYSLDGEGALARLHVEAWIAREALSGLGELRILALADDAGLDLDDMVSRPVTLWTTRADGSRYGRSGVLRQAELLAGDAGMARYRLTVVPWLWLATQQRRSRMFEQRALLDIVQHVLDGYEGCTSQIADDVQDYLADLPVRPYTTQYRESDYDFLSRLLAEAGLGWTSVEDEDAPLKHAVRIFADSRGLPEDPESAQQGVRFHRADATESRDTVQAFARRYRQGAGRVTVLGWHASGKYAVSGEASASSAGGDDALVPEWYEAAGHGAFENEAQAQRQATVALESIQARIETFAGRGGVRTFRSGTRFRLDDMSPLGPSSEEGFEPLFALDRIEHVGVNNLPVAAQATLETQLGGMAQWLDYDTPPYADERMVVPTDDHHAQTPDAAVLAKARAVGYANAFDAVRCDRPWRAALAGGRGARFHAASTAHGVHTALVVGADGTGGAAQSGDTEEIHRNRRGDVRVRFHWQEAQSDGEAHSRWARVAQRQSGAGMGMTFVPRIGQEVLVRFLDDDIDQPVVVGAVYNGRGEGGAPATPGGRTVQEADTSAFAAARDMIPSGQANLAGGNAPAWHGAAAADDAHRNAAALSGFKSKEFGGAGYNHVVFDDSDGQQRLQLKSTQSATELNLGHIIHQAGNYRGGVRGTGAELRSDAYGAVRGGAGVLITSYHGDDTEPAGEAAGVQALAKQADKLSRTLDKGAADHEGVRLAAAAGTEKPDTSILDDKKAPLAAMQAAVASGVSGEDLPTAKRDAADRNTQTGDGKVPHLGDAAIFVAARAGLVQTAGEHMQVTAGETVHWSAGRHQNLASMGNLRVHTGQALGVVAGVQRGGEPGLSVIAGQGPLLVQAQKDVMTVTAREAVHVSSASAQVELAAPKRIRIATAQGASIVLEGGNITVNAPGRIDVHSADKKFTGPDSMSYSLPAFAQGEDEPFKLGLRLQDMPGAHGVAPEGETWRIVKVPSDLASVDEGGRLDPAIFDSSQWDEVLHEGTTPADGTLALDEAQQRALNAKVTQYPGRVWLVRGLHAQAMTPARYSTDGSQASSNKVLDALNFARNGTRLDGNYADWLSEHAVADGDVQGVGQLKPKTDA
ncbi:MULTISPECIES: type VI secretion system Vgr family protein [unclassified Achromobacter]|uniref:type VI secretion system Vgr family protein n=1 Tax=unclassified Achromobacter TaxID=2626865 RepID=UPI000B51926F|nr:MULTISPECIES: type VI secretion system Vgr family protein [unclassified Achromobacter]OWT69114.1 type IV secretion protein Rhs [Achromobacter sp. HZ34]OWT70519.1 type IV secretion protein Rhs [Achromobacter sp. HZ28]